MSNETVKPYYQSKLEEALNARKRKNSSYSLRAFARDLGVNAATLHNVLKGHRRLPVTSALEVCQRLDLLPKQKENFLESLYQQKSSLKDLLKEDLLLKEKFLEEENFYRIISEWEYFAVFELIDTEDFKFDTDWIAQRLSLSTARVQEVLDGLIRTQLILVDENKQVQKNHEKLQTSNDITSKALQEAHEENMRIGIEKLKEVPLELREFQSYTIPVDPDDFSDVKDLIREFMGRLEALCAKKKKREVYNFCFQAYPLTKTQEKKEK